MEYSKTAIGKDGRLSLPKDQQRRWGLVPGAEVSFEETERGILLRRADPALHKVYVEPTTACNLNCRICMRNSWSEPSGFMEMPVYRRLIAGLEALPTLAKVAFWGFGEPLLHPHIVEMVTLAKGLGAKTELISNGLLLDRSLAEGLVTAGLDTLVLSVDGGAADACADTKSGSDLRVVQENVQVLHAVRRARGGLHPQIGLEFVVTHGNVQQLPNLRRLAARMGASFVLITNLLPYSSDTKDDITYWLSIDARGHSEYNPEIRLPPIDGRPQYLQPLLELLRHAGAVDTAQRDFAGADGYCRFVHDGVAAISWDGAVGPCIPLMHSYTCYVLGREKTIRRCTLGNVNEQELTAIWNRAEFAQLRSKVLRFEFSPCAECGGCYMADSNEEDCYGNTFPVCGDCLWARGIIQCP
jgi:MoaA/NifB/PqqE/SkfB family radical SAM enzyme